MTASSLDIEQVRRQYEVARQAAAADVAFSRRGYGVALLMSRGMPAWLKAVATLCVPPVESPPAEKRRPRLGAARPFRDGACVGEPGARPHCGGHIPMSQSTAVTADHLRRLACLYVRQSSLQQVQDHQESTARQYALKRRALALGWAAERIVVIDEDLGLSGASAAERTGFQRIVADVGLGRVGMVMGLEVSRLARNSSDWHRLLEICALSETLILDEDGLYDPLTRQRAPPDRVPTAARGAPDLRRIAAAVVEQVRALATEQTDEQIADTLNGRRLRTGTQAELTANLRERGQLAD